MMLRTAKKTAKLHYFFERSWRREGSLQIGINFRKITVFLGIYRGNDVVVQEFY